MKVVKAEKGRPLQTERLQQTQKLASSIVHIISNLISMHEKTLTTTTTTTEAALDRIFSDSLSVSRVVTGRPHRRRVMQTINSKRVTNSPVTRIKLPPSVDVASMFQSIILSGLGFRSPGTTARTTTTTTTTATTRKFYTSLLFENMSIEILYEYSIQKCN